jgi:SMC interacting uncharacterized protein involved in chromosome segregation
MPETDDIEKFFDDMAIKSAKYLSMSNPNWLAEYAAQIAIKADKLEKEIAKLNDESEARLLDASTAWDLCETMRIRIEELETALEPFAEMTATIVDGMVAHSFTMDDIRTARKVLGEKE